MLRMIAPALLGTLPRLSIWDYQVHGRRAAFERTAVTLPASEIEQTRKIAAIRCHRTQMMLSSRRFLGYASCPETFRRLNPLRAVGHRQTAATVSR
jgi:LmbE family N-acetylglucosaminyl deacetylase